MNNEEIRSFIEIANIMNTPGDDVVLHEDVSIVGNSKDPDSQIIERSFEDRCADLIFKLRSYQDPEMGEYSAGVEAGMNRAAEMVENMVYRLRGQ